MQKIDDGLRTNERLQRHVVRSFSHIAMIVGPPVFYGAYNRMKITYARTWRVKGGRGELFKRSELSGAYDNDTCSKTISPSATAALHVH